jgi:hypothetical protein
MVYQIKSEIMGTSDTPTGGLRQTDDSPDDVTEAIVELIKQRKELRERRAEVYGPMATDGGERPGDGV